MKIIILWVCFSAFSVQAASEPKAVPKEAAKVMTPSPLPSLAPSPMPSLVMPLLPDEAKSLLKQFKKAQDAEMKGLEHRQKLELQELKASHSARQKDWDQREKESRHKFFGENREGPARRVFVKDFLERRKSMHSLLSQELQDRENELKVRRESLHSEHAEKRSQFEKLIALGKRPPTELWPLPGR